MIHMHVYRKMDVMREHISHILELREIQEYFSQFQGISQKFTEHIATPDICWISVCQAEARQSANSHYSCFVPVILIQVVINIMNIKKNPKQKVVSVLFTVEEFKWTEHFDERTF